METFFKEKSVRCWSSTLRGQQEHCSLKLLKPWFEDVQGVAGVKEAIEMMEVEPVDWVTPLQIDKAENAFTLLELVYTEPMLRHIRVSFLLEDTEQEYVPDGIAHGMLSHHIKPFTKDSLTQDIKDLLDRIESFTECIPNCRILPSQKP